jgi:glycosyltransferase involved in cell wall biosynthesis
MLTFVIKTFCRPKQLQRLLRSIAEFAPGIPVVVADDGSPYAHEAIDLPPVFDYLELSYDSGIAAGRNLAVNKVETPYVVLLDDDLILDRNHPIDNALNYLPTSDLDLLGFVWFESSKNRLRKLRRSFYVVGDTLQMYPSITRVNQHITCDMCHNSFIAKTKMILENRWDEDLKLQEHWDYFYRFSGNVGMLCDGYLIHDHVVPSVHYKSMRHDRAKAFKKIALDKHGFKKITRIRPTMIHQVLKEVAAGHVTLSDVAQRDHLQLQILEQWFEATYGRGNSKARGDSEIRPR